MPDDMDVFLKEGIDAVINRRAERGQRLAKKLVDVPKGLSFKEFLLHQEVSDLELDFITAHEMFEAYNEEKA